MNPDTGDIGRFLNEEEANKAGYTIPLAKGDLVKIKGVTFRITRIDHQGNTLNLKAMDPMDAISYEQEKMQERNLKCQS